MSTTNNKATAKQAAFCESLARKITKEEFVEIFNSVGKDVGQYTTASFTVTQAVRRMNKERASKVIGLLLEATK